MGADAQAPRDRIEKLEIFHGRLRRDEQGIEDGAQKMIEGRLRAGRGGSRQLEHRLQRPMEAQRA